jgi:lactoylglutathione lyase
MKINHIALWANNLEEIRDFYTTYFNMVCGEKYVNETKGFTSYFLSFEDSETRLEIMNQQNISDHIGGDLRVCGLAHIAISVGDKTKVDELTAKLKTDGYIVASGPRMTGDGYYESVVLDPEGNLVEITE